MGDEIKELLENTKKLCKIWNENCDKQYLTKDIDEYFEKLGRHTVIIGRSTAKQIKQILDSVYSLCDNDTQNQISIIKKSIGE